MFFKIFYDCLMILFSWFGTRSHPTPMGHVPTQLPTVFASKCLFNECLMIIRWFRCVFSKNVLLAAAGSTFSLLDIQPFFCLFLGFQSSRRSGWERVPSELGGNVSCQSWVGTRPVRSCAFVFSLLSEMSSFGKCASGCSGKHFFLICFDDVWKIC